MEGKLQDAGLAQYYSKLVDAGFANWEDVVSLTTGWEEDSSKRELFNTLCKDQLGMNGTDRTKLVHATKSEPGGADSSSASEPADEEKPVLVTVSVTPAMPGQPVEVEEKKEEPAKEDPQGEPKPAVAAKESGEVRKSELKIAVNGLEWSAVEAQPGQPADASEKPAEDERLMGQELVLSTATEYQDVAFGESVDEFIVMASVRAPFFQPASRAPVDIICVIDRSGSMSGERIILAKRTLEFIVNNLTASDRLAVDGIRPNRDIFIRE